MAPPSDRFAADHPLADALQLVKSRNVPAQLCVIHDAILAACPPPRDP